MKIGLMTWFQYHNYGTSLQVYAMNRVLSQLGNDVCLINYKTNGKRTVKNTAFEKIANKADYYINKPIIANPSRDERFVSFLKEISLTTEKKTLSELQDLNSQFDAFVCGSDQIWSPFCFDERYFLDFVTDDSKKIAYAPSVGTGIIEDKNIECRIKELTSCFGSLSTREKVGSDLIGNITGRNVNTVLDPTLLLNRKEWENIASDSVSTENYAFVYMLGHDKKQWRKIHKFASKMNLVLKIVPVYEKDYSRFGCIEDPIGPEEFINLIANAKYVFTDSFHGTIFSIIFNKRFLVFERFSERSRINQNSRIYNLLSLFSLESRLYSKQCTWDKPIAYDRVNKDLVLLRQESLDYLRHALKNVTKPIERKQNIRQHHSLCCGCGVCENICPIKAIEVIRNDDGFFTAIVNDDKCISCGKCREYCPYINIKSKRIDTSDFISYKDNRLNVLETSSSGGLSLALSEILLDEGYAIVGCEYDRDVGYSKHIIITSKKELPKIQGSKYMQSDFACIVPELKNYEKIAIFGTPCQVAAAKKFLGNKEAVYIDLICHGVPSYNLFKKYKQYLEEREKINTEEMDISFRYKKGGWREIYIYVSDGNKEVVKHQSEDPYFLMFEHGLCYGKQCFECPWRDRSEADIRIGDFWGDKYKDDKTGVSIAAINTSTGGALVSKLKEKNKGRIQDSRKEDYFTNQQTENLQEPYCRNDVICLLKDNNNKTLEDIVEQYIVPLERQRAHDKRVLQLKKGIKHILKHVKVKV